MNLQEILNHRRAVRHYDPAQPLDAEKVKECIEMAALAPTSSNMQLWEAYHVVDKDTLNKLAEACLGQRSATSAQQMVVFVTRQDRYNRHRKEIMKASFDEIERNSPEERKAPRRKLVETYYGKLMPFQYSRFFGLLGLLRKLLVQGIGMFRPILRQVSEQDVRVAVNKSCGLVVQTFMLAMAEKGYDTCPLEGFDSWRVKKILNLPYHTEINMIITCGMRLPTGIHGPRYRLPFEEMYKRV